MRIYDGRNHFSQWDKDVMITSTDFKIGDEVHITNNRLPNAMTVVVYEYNGKAVIDVPNILLQTTYPIIVFRYVQDGKSGYTIEKSEFTVNQKPKPNDYVYTETEILTIKTAVDKALLEAKESGEFDGADGKDGIDGKTPVKGVDYWTTSDKEEIKNESAEVFIAEYGVTTFAEMDEAYNAGKLLFCRDGKYLVPVYDFIAGVSVSFYRVTSTQVVNYYRTAKGTWNQKTLNLCASTHEDFDSRITALETTVASLTETDIYEIRSLIDELDSRITALENASGV